MIFTLMSVEAMHRLFEDVYNEVGFLTVKFPKSNKLFIYDGKVLSGDRIAVYLQYNKHLVQTSAKELLVEMTYQTYQLRKLQDDADYKLALSVFEQYFASAQESDEGRFAYLLSLVIADYESEHYPMASLSTVNFIDHLLEERSRSWANIRAYLGYADYVSLDFVKSLFKSENMKAEHVINLSHFFKIPVQAFIVGGYGE